jgi:RimJ/RimL family protein N-acetyltransferase
MLLQNLESQRLRFIGLTEDHHPVITGYLSDPETTRFLFPTVGPETQARLWITRQNLRYERDGYGLCALEEKATGNVAGFVGLILQEVDGIPELEIGYHLFPRHRGKGYATEAAVTCRDFAFKHQLADHLISLIHPDNIASQKVAIRNGMKAGRQTKFRGHPVLVFRISREEWEGIK